MVPMTESEKPDEKIIPPSFDSSKRLDVQIRKMPELTNQARMIDQVLAHRLQEIRGTASAIIDHFNEQKKMILQRFDSWIMPIAQDVLDGLLRDAEHLKYKLEHKLEHPDQMTSSEWDKEAKDWALLYETWHDRKGLVNKILEVVADRTKHLIDKDIQVIHDYQNQSLAHLPPESEAFRNVEQRMSQAIEEPLKQLLSLRNEAKEQTSIQQASEWVAKLQERREGYFDQLLMKIDHVMKDVVNLDDVKDMTAFIDIEGEILFMEHELHYIKTDLTIYISSKKATNNFLLQDWRRS